MDSYNDNIILNPRFEDGLSTWSGVGCNVTLKNTVEDGKIMPQYGKAFLVASGRTETLNGVSQDITTRVQGNMVYEINAIVRIHSQTSSARSANTQATLSLGMPDQHESKITISLGEATEEDWMQLQGKFIVSNSPTRVSICINGPPPGTDILLNSLIVKAAEISQPSPPPEISKKPAFGVNIIQNSDFTENTNGWYPIGNCTLSLGTQHCRVIPRSSVGHQNLHDQPPSGRYMIVTNRTTTRDGVAQNISTNKMQSFLTYQVSAWVKVGVPTKRVASLGESTAQTQSVNVSLILDGKWFKGGHIDAKSDGSVWCQIFCSFRIEKHQMPSNVVFQVQGPDSGVDLMISGACILAVDRKSRFRHLKKHINQVRKRDVILKFKAPANKGETDLKGATVIVKQTKNSFPFGSCITRSDLDNEKLVSFFLNNFNWAVFGNELKWYHTEPQKSNFNYKDADEMLDFCSKNNINVRGHCIFWAVEAMVQQWVRSLSKDDLSSAVQSRLTGLLNRYKDKFRHYDVNNEMLHGTYYQDHLGKEIHAYMFKTSRELDPDATLFVNDYNVENGGDSKATASKYIDQIAELQGQGAEVGGIGIQGHMDSPVGEIVASNLDKLSTLNIPIWFTELDVTSSNEHVRADDLEVMLREAYAHPSVEGVVFWGFYEGTMWRQNAHLVNADGVVNEAGKRFIELKKEWMSNAHGVTDDAGEYKFRGFYGDYQVDVVLPAAAGMGNKSISKTFVVDKSGAGNASDALVVSIDL